MLYFLNIFQTFGARHASKEYLERKRKHIWFFFVMMLLLFWKKVRFLVLANVKCCKMYVVLIPYFSKRTAGFNIIFNKRNDHSCLIKPIVVLHGATVHALPCSASAQQQQQQDLNQSDLLLKSFFYLMMLGKDYSVCNIMVSKIASQFSSM